MTVSLFGKYLPSDLNTADCHRTWQTSRACNWLTGNTRLGHGILWVKH